MPPHLESMYYGCNFQVMRGIILLMIFQLSRLITYHMVVLHKNSSKSFTACISAHHKVLFWVYNFQNGYTCEKILQLLEASLTFRCPFKFHPLPLQRSYRMYNLGESLNESPIISCKSHKRPCICHIPWRWLVHDGFNIFRVHKYSII